MRFTPSIFGKLLEPIRRRQFDTLVARHAGDAYVKAFPSWNHLLALVYAQFAAAVSLRGLEAGWNANRQHHYHLGSGPLVRSTLCDANKRDRLLYSPRPSAGWQANWIDRRDATARRWSS
jgi:putative transposase